LADRFEEAQALVPEVEDRFHETARPLEIVRLRWTAGNIAFGLGRLDEAEAAYREVQQDFLKHGVLYSVALVSLDLALLLSGQGRTAELKLLAAELMEIFSAQEVHREATAALVLFQRACEEERVTAELIARLATLLRRKGSEKTRIWRAASHSRRTELDFNGPEVSSSAPDCISARSR
jgi:ATP/maltotriose-dependent transcriptional regulator MalT